MTHTPPIDLGDTRAVEAELALLLTRAARARRVDIAAVLERAVATAAANVGGADLLLVASPESIAAQYVTELARLGSDSELPLLRRTEPVVLYFETRDQQLGDYGLRALHDRDVADIRNELSTPGVTDVRRGELADELWRVQELYTYDVENYLQTWTVAATAKAHELGLDNSVPVLVTTDNTAPCDDGDLEPLYDYAFAAVALPGCGYTPQTFPHRIATGQPDIGEFVAAERAAHRTYRGRVAFDLSHAGWTR